MLRVRKSPKLSYEAALNLMLREEFDLEAEEYVPLPKVPLGAQHVSTPEIHA